MASEEVTQQIAMYVRGGYMTAVEIVEVVAEGAGDEGEGVAEEEIVRLVDEAIAARRRELASGSPSYDRLHHVFCELEAAGVLARENYWCCQTCAYSAIDQEIGEASERGDQVRGYVLFHSQDTERVADGGKLLLRYGGVTADPQREGAAATQRIGEEIVMRLRAVDLVPEWTGSPDEVIYLPITWDKAPPVDAK
jgi:hypothetical protein